MTLAISSSVGAAGGRRVEAPPDGGRVGLGPTVSGRIGAGKGRAPRPAGRDRILSDHFQFYSSPEFLSHRRAMRTRSREVDARGTWVGLELVEPADYLP